MGYMKDAGGRRLDSFEVADKADLDATPMLDDLASSRTLADMTATTTVPLIVALYPQQLQQVSLIFSAAIAASNTNYWTVELIRRQAGEVDTVATKTTKTTGGEAITAYTAWTFDTTVLTSNGIVQGASLYLRFTPTGAPAALTGGLVAFRCPPADVTLPVALFSDTFDRANETLLATSSSGQAWDSVSAMGVTSNQGKSTASGWAVKFLSQTDAQVTATLPGFPTAGSAGLYVCYLDQNNYVTTTGSQVTSRIAGATGPLLDSAFDNGLTFAAGDRIRATVLAGKIYVYVDKGNTGTFALATPGATIPPELVANVGVGLRSGGNAAIWDNFDVKSAA